jgi:hypothetical protein
MEGRRLGLRGASLLAGFASCGIATDVDSDFSLLKGACPDG